MDVAKTPKPVLLTGDEEFWSSINNRQMRLQRCSSCKVWRYPSAPLCSECLSEDSTWDPVSGRGEILSWAVFHRTYLPAYPAPYAVIAVRLEEGPIMISSLVGPEPKGTWIGRSVSIRYTEMPDGVLLPTFALDGRFGNA